MCVGRLLGFTWLGPLIGYQMAGRGQFGDLFGGVNALFTGLAFAGVIYTILLQSNELELQREELRLNRHALERSADAQSEQVKRLEEAAELSAVSTLTNVYGMLLAPMRDSTHAHRVEITRLQSELDRPDQHPTYIEKNEILLDQHKSAVEIEEQQWSHILQKEQELVERLETLVDQRSQGRVTTQEP
jgi:hypothetical protein